MTEIEFQEFLAHLREMKKVERKLAKARRILN